MVLGGIEPTTTGNDVAVFNVLRYAKWRTTTDYYYFLPAQPRTRPTMQILGIYGNALHLGSKGDTDRVNLRYQRIGVVVVVVGGWRFSDPKFLSAPFGPQGL